LSFLAFGFVDEGAVRYDGLIFRGPEQSFSGCPDLRTVQPFVTAACRRFWRPRLGPDLGQT
ncbi:hypothetical protein, partial [Photorhabdus viridis]|uniref:hypothetical protein n=1 Tax=Photorhabdus viridis TaxID=3163327 RepID=UPI003307692E